MSKVLELLQAAHEAANAETSADPRMGKVLGHVNQAIGVLDPKAAGQARAATTAQPSLPRGRFGSTPPPRNQPTEINKYDIQGKKKDVAPAVEPQVQERADEAATGNDASDILEAKAATGQLTTVTAGLPAQLSAMTPQEITGKYTKAQLTNIATAMSVDVTGMKPMQIAAAIKTKLAAK